jgi:hypothetical protein
MRCKRKNLVKGSKMKRLSLLGLVFIFMLTLVGTDLNAEKEKNNFSLNFGAMGAYGIGLWTAGINLDLHLADSLMLSPELMTFGWRFHFDSYLLAPGLMLNARHKSVFVGAGLTKWFLISLDDENFESDFLLKFNLGSNMGKLRFAVFAITDFRFSGVLYGATIGIRF